MCRIFLIDDNSKSQRLAYGASYIDEDEYADILSHIEKLTTDVDPSFLDGCECVLIHDSLEDFVNGEFDQYSHKAKDVIVKYLDEHNIPYVCFSDGHQSTGEYDTSKNLVSLKKSDFYNRLKYFLDYYKTEGVIQFHILAYGRNFRKELMLRYVRALFRKLEMKRPSDRLLISDVMPVKTGASTKEEPYLKEIVSLAQPALGMSYNDMLDYIDDEEITVKEFRQRINKILDSVSKNGKNTYTWE